MGSNNVDVLIVGAGPTGLVFACELARRGVTFRLIDELATPQTISKAAAVHARSMEIWDAMGFAETVLPCTRAVRGLNAFADGKRVAHIAIHGIDSPYPHVYGISQSDIEALLTKHLAKAGGRVERSVRLESFVQDDDGVSSTLTLPGGSTEVFRSRWLVGCDGAHSRVRHGLGFPFEGAAYEEKIIQADVHVDLPMLGADDEILGFLGEGNLLALFPLFRDGRFRLVILGGDEANVENPTLEHFQHALEKRLPGARVRDPAWMVSFRIHHRHVDRYHDRSVFIVGDACHIHSPVGGQGMNTGMQDAYNLAWKLALVTHGAARPALLESYGAERLPVALALVTHTDAAMKTVEEAVKLRSPLSIGLRNTLMSFVTRLDFVQGLATRTLSMLGQNYRNGPLSAQDRGTLWQGGGIGDWAAFGHGPAAGDRAPDAPIVGADGQENTLHHLFRTTPFQLLLFAGPADVISPHITDAAARVWERVGDHVSVHIVLAGREVPTNLPPHALPLRDPNGAVHERYGARSECLYLLRPDGYVGYRSHAIDAERLMAYLDRIFVPAVVA